jgi:hypothetical protein
MLTTIERGRLMREMADQPLVKKAIAVQCAVLLGMVALITVIGVMGPEGRNADAPHAAHSPAQPAAAVSTAAHHRETFEQRRERVAGGDSGKRHAETSPGMVSARAQ